MLRFNVINPKVYHLRFIQGLYAKLYFLSNYIFFSLLRIFTFI